MRESGAVTDHLSGPLLGLAATLRLLRDRITAEADQFELNAYAARAEAHATAARDLLAQALAGCVYWVETGKKRRGGDRPNVTVVCVRIGSSVSEMLATAGRLSLTSLLPQYLASAMFARAIAAGECRQINATDGRRLFMAPVNTVMLQIGMMKGMPIDEAATRSFFNHYFRMLADYLVPRPA
jgi:hypothetical protein